MSKCQSCILSWIHLSFIFQLNNKDHVYRQQAVFQSSELYEGSPINEIFMGDFFFFQEFSQIRSLQNFSVKDQIATISALWVMWLCSAKLCHCNMRMAIENRKMNMAIENRKMNIPIKLYLQKKLTTDQFIWEKKQLIVSNYFSRFCLPSSLKLNILFKRMLQGCVVSQNQNMCIDRVVQGLWFQVLLTVGFLNCSSYSFHFYSAPLPSNQY